MISIIKQFEHLKIQLEAIKSATNDFAEVNCIGKGGFGKVYKGELVQSNGHVLVAIKRLDRAFGQGDPEFWKEIIMLSLYRHENIICLLGFCDDGGEKILVYEYSSKHSLDLHLNSNDLTWVRRLRICIGAAKGLAYLHHPGGSQQRLLHRDIKSSNILLDENWDARISDFGLSKFGPANQRYTFLVSNAVGTVGYCDPLYVETGLLTKESDVYSLGVVLFEVLCGRLSTGIQDKRKPLTGLARSCYEHNTLNEIIYGGIKDEINPDSLRLFTTIAYPCLKIDHEQRPLMDEIVTELETALKYQIEKGHQSCCPEGGTGGTSYGSRPGDQPTMVSVQPKVSHLGWGHLYTLRELEIATNGFSDENVIGEGGYGIVYSGVLMDNTSVAVKNLLSNRGQAEKEFKVEVEAIGRVRHKNLVWLLGSCDEGAHRMLVYEYVNNGNLEQWLHGDVGSISPLTWEIRMHIILGTAKGLTYLHEGLDPKVVHGDIKSSNILLDRQWHPKVSDFGLAKLLGSEKGCLTTHVMGTFGYVAPEYASTGMLNERSDVYSFGILIMEIISGRNPVDYSKPADEVNLVDWLKTMVTNRNAEGVLDPKLVVKPFSRTLKRALLVALRCVDPNAQKRPKMGQVINMLEATEM